MRFSDIATMPTSLDSEYVLERARSCKGFHESLLRSYHILGKVKSLLQDGVPPHVTLELIEAMEDSSIWNKAAPPAGKGL